MASSVTCSIRSRELVQKTGGVINVSFRDTTERLLKDFLICSIHASPLGREGEVISRR